MMLVDGRACGLLPGVGWALALRQRRLTEAVVRVEVLPRVQGWAFLNSLRGWIEAQIVSTGFVPFRALALIGWALTALFLIASRLARSRRSTEGLLVTRHSRAA